ncbi:MmyB family transcriptional regulator [Streptomyces sp. NBC_01435]|uniref:MmyB family transcriptional regulator n=1 Tax=Streptomyces sp. NBC_01435 TaxID=2903865 RepID=UPI002E36183B|nr:XRE family transcriptional regulator [Streptomyces sp. NBC_01435]
MNKEALRDLLKSHRDRINPEDHGYERLSRQGRRAPGLTQHQCDQLLTREMGTYRLLESGRNPRPKTDLLRDVATLFGMDEHAWVLLNRYALGQEPPAPLYTDSGFQVPSSWQQAVDGIEHMAYVTDAAWNMVCHNKHLPGMYPGRRVPQNVMRWMCLDPEARTVLADWETEWAPRILPQLRAAVAIHHDATVKQLETDVMADPVAGPLYEARGAVIHPDGDERPLDHPVLGRGWVTMCSATPEGSPGARLMILLFRPGAARPAPHTILRAPGTP